VYPAGLYLAPNGASGNLYTINTSNPNLGQGVAGVALSNAPANITNGQIKGLSFDSLSNLYGIDFQMNTLNADLVMIGSNGAMTSFGALPNGFDSLAIVPEPGSFILTGLVGSGLVATLLYRRVRFRRQRDGMADTLVA
jgi:hypothetical protein